MDAQEAIETLTNELQYIEPDYGFGFINAIKLGIEALKRINNARAIGYSVPADLLPGETKRTEHADHPL